LLLLLLIIVGVIAVAAAVEVVFKDTPFLFAHSGFRLRPGFALSLFFGLDQFMRTRFVMGMANDGGHVAEMNSNVRV